MSVRRLIPLLAPLGVVGAIVISQTTAFAYPPPAASGKNVAGCSQVAQGASCTYTFEFFDSGGNAIDGLLATLGLDAVSGCSLTPTSSTTSGGGNVSAVLSCAPNSGTGSEQVIATSGSVTVTAAVQIVPANAGGGGDTLPFGSTAAPAHGPNAGLIAGIVAALLLIAAGGVFLVRTRKAAA